MLRRTLLSLLLALVAWASAADLVVHPFASQDPVVGVAVAERVASAIVDRRVIGPELAPMVAAPIVVPGGFLNPLVVVPGGAFDENGVALLAGATGVPIVVSGSLVNLPDGVRLDLVAFVDGRLLRAAVRAREGDLDRLTAGAAAAVARWAGTSHLPPRPLDLRGVDQEAARARALLGAGLASDALAVLDRAEGLDPADAAFRDDLRAALADGGGGDAALAAIVSLASADPAAPGPAFARWVDAGGPPVAYVWGGAWADSVGERDEALRLLDAAAAAYPYGRAARAAAAVAHGDEDDARERLGALAVSAEPAALLAGAFAAGALPDPALEDALLAALERAAPFLTYAFERRSFLAFDRDDALTAARALSVAVELAPDSDLYWTNLGWAWYLLGFLDRSEGASLRALQLDASQVIARYNLGLVQVVTDRLDDAMASYRETVRWAAEVDAEAVADLVDAETRYPDAIGVPFALAFLLEQSGDRAAAAEAYERYAARAVADPAAAAADPARVREAAERAAALRAPLPPIEISGSPSLQLGRRGPIVDRPHPGDPLTVVFEVSTRGEALPRRLTLRVELRDAAGTLLASGDALVDVPGGAIGYVTDATLLEVPVDLDAGAYVLTVRAEGDGLVATADATVSVAGAPERVRRLIGRGLVATALESGQPLVGARDLGVAEATVWARWLAELHAVADLAEEVLPEVTEGRFAGRSGGRAFADSTLDDVVAFVDHLLASDARASTFALADAYAQWVVDGTP